MSKVNLELAVGYLKSIVESCRCPICDKITGGRLRYDCGHIVCVDCAEESPECQLCTPPRGSTVLVGDAALTQRVVHVGELVKSFQETYNIDVLKSKRISEQQKIERELFPKCIQAPQTYGNKRKSFIIPRKGKENIPLPGELVSTVSIMDSSENYVQKWLDRHDDDLVKYQPRKPFADISVNSPQSTRTPKKNPTLSLKENAPHQRSTKKRSFKTALSAVNSQSILDNYIKQRNNSNLSQRAKKLRQEFEKYEKEDRAKGRVKSDKNESGIEMDDDLVIIDDDASAVDKDHAAWLAVLAADNSSSAKKVKREVATNRTSVKNTKTLAVKPKPVPTFSSEVLNWMSSETSDLKPETIVKEAKENKVPFYRKGPLLKLKECCHKKPKKDAIKDKNISVKVEAKGVVATITVNKCERNVPRLLETNSQATQTEESVIDGPKVDVDTIDKNMNSEDLFTVEIKETAPKFLNEEIKPTYNLDVALDGIEKDSKDVELDTYKPVFHEIIPKGNRTIISDSGSDSDHNLSGTLTVKADVHRSHDDNEIQGILQEISLSEIRVPKAIKRGRTPASTDSSDKENRDPNTKRKRRDGKKSKKKVN